MHWIRLLWLRLRWTYWCLRCLPSKDLTRMEESLRKHKEAGHFRLGMGIAMVLAATGDLDIGRGEPNDVGEHIRKLRESMAGKLDALDAGISRGLEESERKLDWIASKPATFSVPFSIADHLKKPKP